MGFLYGGALIQIFGTIFGRTSAGRCTIRAQTGNLSMIVKRHSENYEHLLYRIANYDANAVIPNPFGLALFGTYSIGMDG